MTKTIESKRHRSSAAPIATPTRPPQRVGAAAVPQSWNSTSLAMLSVVGVLIVIGLVFVLSASSVYSLRTSGSSYAIFRRQLIWVGLGVLALFATLRIHYVRWQSWANAIVIVSVGMVIATFTPFGVARYGAKRWIGPSAVQVQPSELLKLGLAICLCNLLAVRAHRLHVTRVTLRPVLIISGVSAGLVLLQPDMGTAMLLVVIAASVIVVGGVPTSMLARTFFATGVLALIAARIEPYRWERVTSFLNNNDLQGTGYHLHQSLIGLGSGRLFGLGVGASRAKWGFLPNAHTDFIFSVIGEELGLVGALLILVLFVAFLLLGLHSARRAPDRFGRLLACAITTWIVAQALVNVGAVIGLLPVTGVPLPFISVGGSSFIVTMAAIGILVQIARRGVVVETSGVQSAGVQSAGVQHSGLPPQLADRATDGQP
jgi:cell division protein FtsW